MAEIRTKDEFLRLSALGLVGNQMPNWDSVEDAIAAGHTGEVMIRYKGVNSPFMRPNVPLGDVDATIDSMVAKGADRARFYLTWMSPYVGRRLNAELWWSPSLYLNYSHKDTHLREALEKHGLHAEGLSALLVLQGVCDANSMDDFRDLWERYPDSVFEFSVFDRQIGSIPGRNTVIWEIRNY